MHMEHHQEQAKNQPVSISTVIVVTLVFFIKQEIFRKGRGMERWLKIDMGYETKGMARAQMHTM